MIKLRDKEAMREQERPVELNDVITLDFGPLLQQARTCFVSVSRQRWSSHTIKLLQSRLVALFISLTHNRAVNISYDDEHSVHDGVLQQQSTVCRN